MPPGRQDKAPIREPGDLPSSDVDATNTGRGVPVDDPKDAASLLVLARADGRSREDSSCSAFLKSAVDDASTDQRAKVGTLYFFLFTANALVWTWAVIAFADRPTLLGTAFLAYVLGLRHAVDADHIAAIDNVVRKLMQEGKRPFSAGLFFSLGHSLAITLAVAGDRGGGFRAARSFTNSNRSAASSAPAPRHFSCSPSPAINLVILRACGGAFVARAAASRSPNRS